MKSRRQVNLLGFCIALAISLAWSLGVNCNTLFAQGQTSFDISSPQEDSGAPVGTIEAAGTWLPNAGCLGLNTTFYAFNTLGGIYGQSLATTTPPFKSNPGTWSAQVLDVPAGTYKTFARTVYVSGTAPNFTYYFVDTETRSVTVTVNTVTQAAGTMSYTTGLPNSPAAFTLQASGPYTVDSGYNGVRAYFTAHKTTGGHIMTSTSNTFASDMGFATGLCGVSPNVWPNTGSLSVGSLGALTTYECYAFFKEQKTGSADIFISAPFTTATTQ